MLNNNTVKQDQHFDEVLLAIGFWLVKVKIWDEVEIKTIYKL